MMGRRLRSPLSLVNPLSSSGMKTEIKESEDRIKSEKTLRRLEVGDRMLYRDVVKKTWKPGVITKVSDKQYDIQGNNGSNVAKHIDHLVSPTIVPDEEVTDEQQEEVRKKSKLVVANSDLSQQLDLHTSMPTISDNNKPLPSNVPSTPPSIPTEVRPSRVRTPPAKLNHDKLGG